MRKRRSEGGRGEVKEGEEEEGKRSGRGGRKEGREKGGKGRGA